MSRLRRLIAALALLIAVALIAGCSSDDGPKYKGAALPRDFPTEQVPLIDDATVLTASGTHKDGWSVTVQGPATAGNQLDAAAKKLTGAGFTESQRTSQGGQSVVVLSADKDGTKYWVQVGTSPQAATGGSSVFYMVSVAGK